MVADWLIMERKNYRQTGNNRHFFSPIGWQACGTRKKPTHEHWYSTHSLLYRDVKRGLPGRIWKAPQTELKE
jgi:hypothetical protein